MKKGPQRLKCLGPLNASGMQPCGRAKVTHSPFQLLICLNSGYSSVLLAPNSFVLFLRPFSPSLYTCGLALEVRLDRRSFPDDEDDGGYLIEHLIMH